MKDWKESGGALKWRYDGRCGENYPLPDGTPGQCDPDGENPCCNDEFIGEYFNKIFIPNIPTIFFLVQTNVRVLLYQMNYKIYKIFKIYKIYKIFKFQNLYFMYLVLISDSDAF